ncbi:MAG: hypothetical protein KC996_01845 [Phycisphaerales bacterium]|nr:hypothetical protein [Phycisphaerales bacterium]
MSSAKHKMLIETTQRRDEANLLLRTLLDAKKISERNLAAIRQPDLVKKVTGKSSMDNAIESTRKLIDSFNRVLDDLRRNLSEEDLAMLGPIESSLVSSGAR